MEAEILPMDQKRRLEARQGEQHPEANINPQNKQPDLDKGSKQSKFAALILEMGNVEPCCTLGKCGVLDHTNKVIDMLQKGFKS